MSYHDRLRADLINDEGLRLKPYKCPAGKLTIGVGRNLEDNGITKEEALFLLDNDIVQAEASARVLFPNFDSLSDNRKAVLCNMAFNLGQSRLAGFKKLRAAVAAENFDEAAAQMLHSAWALQVGRRAQRLANMMKEG